jgi:hypothetical protein
MIAVERIETFSAMEQEAKHVMPETDPSPESGWPNSGEIKMTKVSMRYRSVHLTFRPHVSSVKTCLWS